MAENASSKAFDWAARNTIDLARVEAGSVSKVKAFLGGLEADLVKILAQNPDLSTAKKKKFETIISSANLAISSTYSKIKSESSADLKSLAGSQSKVAVKMVNAGIGVDVLGAVLTEKQLEAVASSTTVFGHSSGAWWQAQEDGLKFKFAGQMKQGYALGEDIDALTRRVRGTKANGFKDGIMAVSKREGEALVRSSIQTISNEARLKSFAELGDTIKGIEWVATLDTRTTKICRALDGLVWTVPGLKPVKHDKVFPGPTAHWNCRSTQIPVLRSWAELAGKPIKALDGETYAAKLQEKLKAKGMDEGQIATAVANARASMDGQASGSPDMEKWLKGKSDAFVKKAIGPSRAKMFAEGKIGIHDLTDQDNRPLTVAQLQAGIDAGDFPFETEGFDFEPFDKSKLKSFDDNQAIQAQDAAKKKIQDVLANPKTPGNSILATNLSKVQADEPSLSPAETLAKAEELTAAKIAANTKSSILSKAKKKILAGEQPTAGQKAVIDDLGDDEKAAWQESIDDAKKATQVAIAEQAATAKLTAWDKDPTKKFAVEKAYQEAFDGNAPDDPVSIAAAADEFLTDIVATDVMTNGTSASKKAVKALTGMDSPTDKSIKAWLKKEGKDAETFLTEWQTLTKEKAEQSVKSSVLSKAKKKLAAGEQPTPAQKLAIDSLTDEEKAAFDEQVDDVKKKVQAEADKKEAILVDAATKALTGQPLTDEQGKLISALSPKDKAAFWDEVNYQKTVLADKAVQATIQAAQAQEDADNAKKAAVEAQAQAEAALKAQTAKDAKKKIDQAKAAAKTSAATVPHPDKLKIVKTLGGSTGAKLAEDAQGNRYVVKRGADADHVRTEFLADELYRAMGHNVPEGGLFETASGPVKVTKFLEGGVPLQNLTGKARDDAFAKLRAGFEADALMANWDVAGTGLDNVMVTPDGQVWRIDNGGSLQFRAQGSLVGKNFDRFPDEIWTMREAGNISAPIYGSMDTLQIARQIDAADLDAVLRVPMPDETRDILEGRIFEMKHLAKRAIDFDHDGYSVQHLDGVAKSTLDLRKTGVSGTMPKTLTGETYSPYILKDENGRSFGNLRTTNNSASAPVVPKVPGDVYSDDILIATKAMASAANNAKDLSTGSAMGKTQTALKHKAKMEAILASGTADADQAAMAQTYLDQLNALEKLAKAGGIPATSPPMFSAYSPKVAKTPTAQPPSGSVVKQWEDMMKAEGIDPSPIAEWMSSQSGNSWTTKTQAMKVAFAKEFKDPETAFYWEGNNIKTSWKEAQKHYKTAVTKAGGQVKFDRMMTSWHALTQEVLSEVDAPWIDKKNRAVLLYRTVDSTEIAGSFEKPDKNGIFTPKRGTTESHSIYKTTSIKGSIVTVQAVPFSRVLATYWTEKPGSRGGSGFLGDGEAEFAANTSGIKALKPSSYKAPAFDEASKDAKTWGVPLDHLREKS